MKIMKQSISLFLLVSLLFLNSTTGYAEEKYIEIDEQFGKNKVPSVSLDNGDTWIELDSRKLDNALAEKSNVNCNNLNSRDLELIKNEKIENSKKYYSEDKEDKKIKIDVSMDKSEMGVKSNSPDLRVYDLKIKSGYTHPFEAEEMTKFEYTLANHSIYDCSNVTVGLKIDDSLVYTFSAGDIGALNGYIKTIAITGMKEGMHTIEIVADPHNTIVETNEDNNSDTNSYTWIGTPDLFADTFTDTENSSSYSAGTSVPVYFKVKNIGTGKAEGESKIFLTVNGNRIAGWGVNNFPAKSYFEKNINLTFNVQGSYDVN